VINLKSILTWSSLSIAMVALVGFTSVQHQSRVCSELEFILDEDSGMFFVSKEDVDYKIKTVHDQVVGMPLSEINTSAIEEAVKQLPEVKSVAVYLTIDGKLRLNISQRKPLVRVMPKRGSGYYIDDEGKYMPLSKNYSARVLVVSGEFVQRYRNISMSYLAENDSIKQLTLFDEICELAQFVEANPFWKAQIQHAYVNENQEFELIPRVGSHNIELGNTTNLPGKFERLMIFYKEGLPYSDWNRYSKISLKFDNQVVCTFKETPL